MSILVNDDAKNARILTRRAFFIAGMQLGILGILGGRLGWLQISQGGLYKTLSDRNRINVKILPPPRGEILDRMGIPLATSTQNFRVQIIPEQTDDIEASLRRLQKHIDLEDSVIRKVLEQAKRSPKFAPIDIKEALDWQDVATVEVNLPNLPGLSTEMGEIRNYPFGPATSHLIGYVGSVSKAELTDDPLLKLPGFRIGKAGLEKSMDTPMRGQAGSAEVEVNVVGREIRELKRNPPRPGQKLRLSIDAHLQLQAHERLMKERSASVVVMDAHTGAVYALASCPGYDTNAFARGLSPQEWNALLNDPTVPLTNKAVAGQYPPASTFKMITALAGLRTGKINAARRVTCTGHYDFGNARFHCWKPEGHGSVNVIEALVVSCDTYFYDLATEIGIEAIAETARMMGLGKKLGFELEEERPGLVPDKNWKKSTLGQSWALGETIVASIGQGYTLATPLQLAVMTARLVNGGKAVRPHLIAAQGDKIYNAPEWPSLKINPAHLALIKEGMDRVVNEPGGTAYGARMTEPGLSMGGKTGTAQVRRITREQRAAGVKNQDLPWHHRHHALFVGYAPMDNPRYVCATVVEHGVGGAAAAAPLARDVLAVTLKVDPAQQQGSVQNLLQPLSSSPGTGQEQKKGPAT
ncbi:MAG: penicillin-binding protein 2 [Alphaproteobacteria bacterium]|nr:penicillin-binding protein 2 [Alphaproteobacteria bacterium]